MTPEYSIDQPARAGRVLQLAAMVTTSIVACMWMEQGTFYRHGLKAFAPGGHPKAIQRKPCLCLSSHFRTIFCNAPSINPRAAIFSSHHSESTELVSACPPGASKYFR